MKTLYLFAILCLALATGQMFKGINWSVYDANYKCKPYETIVEDFRFIKTFAQGVKIYSLGDCVGGSQTVSAAKTVGLQVFLGMAAGPDWAFQNEIKLLKGIINDYGLSNVVGISVGTEDIYRGELSAQTIANGIVQVQQVLRAAGWNTPVTHTDALPTPDEILAVEDIMMYNIFPFWQGTDVSNALGAVIGNYEYNKARAGNQPVWIGETGWPSGGHDINQAKANLKDAGIFLAQFICWANANNIPYYYFEAFDEPNKYGSSATGDIEANFGVYNVDKTPKFTAFTCDGSNGPPAANPIPATSVTSVAPTSTPVALPSTTSALPAPTTSQNVAAPTTSQVVTPNPSSSNVATPATSSQNNAAVTTSAVAPVATSSKIVAATSSVVVDTPQDTVQRAQGSASSITVGLLGVFLMVILF